MKKNKSGVADGGYGGYVCSRKQRDLGGNYCWVGTWRQRVGETDLKFVGSGGERERAAAIAECKAADVTGLAINQDVDGEAGIQIVGQISARDAVDDI